MAINKEIKEKIATLSKEDLFKLVLKVAGKDKIFLDYIKLTYFKDEIDENEVLNDYISKTNSLIFKRYRGYADEEKAANYIVACNKEIANFEKISKNKEHLVDLIIHVLDNARSDFDARFGTCFTVYEYKYYLLLKKAIKIVTTQLHEDLMLEYKDRINEHLSALKISKHLDYIYDLQESI